MNDTVVQTPADDPTILPPLGMIQEKDWGRVHQLLRGMLEMGNEALSPNCDRADKNLTIYRHGSSTQIKSGAVVSNSIRDDVLTSVAKIAGDDPEIVISPVETGSPGVPFIMAPTPGMGPPMGPPDMSGQEEPQDQMADPSQGGMQQPMGPQVIMIDDMMQAKFWQRQFDYYWAKGRINKSIKAAILNAAVAGWTFVMFEWEASSSKPKLWTTISPRQIGIDPAVGPVDAVDEANFAWVRWYIDRWRARRMYPHLADLIQTRAREGPPRSDGVTTLGSNVDRNHRVKMVDLTHWFLRDQPIKPMTPEEAIAGGLVEATPSDDGVSIGYVMAGTTTAVTPTDSIWPWWTGLRHITMIDEIVADDKLCTYWDIPFGHCVMIPSPNSPFGIGLPEGMIAMQDGRNSMLTDVKDHCTLLAHPPLVISESTARDLDIKKKNPFLARDKIFVAPDELLARTNGKLTTTIEPPPLHEATIQGLEIFKAELGERSQTREVSQGKQPGQVTGWQSISLLQQAASSRYDLEGQFVSDMIWRVARLLLHELIFRLSPEELAKVCSDMPIELIAQLKMMAMQGEWDIQANVFSAVAGIQARKKAEDVEKFNTRDPFGKSVISMTTLRERMNEDNAQEEQRLAQETMQGMALAAMMNPQQDGEDNGKRPGADRGSNGNGRGSPASPASPQG